MLIEGLNTMCKDFVTSLAQTFGKNQNLQMAKMYVSSLPSTSKQPLEFISEHLVEHSDLIESRDVRLFDQPELKDYVAKWKIREMYSIMGMESQETFWDDLDEIVKRVKIILCAGEQLDGFESVAQNIVDRTGIRDLPPEERNISTVLQKVMTSFMEDPRIASDVGALMQNLDEKSQKRVLKLTGMEHIVEKFKDLKVAQERNEESSQEPDHSEENAAYFANQDLTNQEVLNPSASTPPPSPQSAPPSSPSTDIVPPPPSTPFDFSQMNKTMFMQLAKQLKQSGELESALEEVDSSPNVPGMPAIPPNMDFTKIIESITKDGGILSAFSKSIPKGNRR